MDHRDISLIPGSSSSSRYMFFLFSKPPWLLGLLNWYQVKCGQERDDNHTPKTSAQVKNAWNSTSIVYTETTLPSFFFQNLSYFILRFDEEKQ
jgi:hypothetical protein